MDKKIELLEIFGLRSIRHQGSSEIQVNDLIKDHYINRENPASEIVCGNISPKEFTQEVEPRESKTWLWKRHRTSP